MVFASCLYLLNRNSDFTNRVLCPSRTTVSRLFPSSRETEWNNQAIWILSTRWSRNYISREYFAYVFCNKIL